MADSVLARALEIDSPGFDSLLSVIQSETNRIEQNRALAQQRKAQLEMMELKKEYDIEIYNETIGAQQQANRELERELATARLTAEQQREQARRQTKIADNLLDQKAKLQADLKAEFNKRYRPLIDSGFLIPNIEGVQVGVSGDSNELEGYYQLDSGEYITPSQYDREYGWALRAEKVIEAYNKDRQNIRESTREEGVQENSILETVFDTAVDLSTVLDHPEQAKETLNRKYLGRQDAAEKIAQLRNGNQQVLREFEMGLLQFNVMSKMDAEVAPNIRSDIQNVLDFLGSNVTTDTKYGLFGFDPLGPVLPGLGGVASSFFTRVTADRLIGGASVDKISSFILDNADDAVIRRWNELLDNYPRLDNATRKPWSELYINPYYDNNTPLSEFFITKDRLAVIERERKANTGTDTELSNDFIRSKKSQSILQQALYN